MNKIKHLFTSVNYVDLKNRCILIIGTLEMNVVSIAWTAIGKKIPSERMNVEPGFTVIQKHFLLIRNTSLKS